MSQTHQSFVALSATGAKVAGFDSLEMARQFQKRRREKQVPIRVARVTTIIEDLDDNG